MSTELYPPSNFPHQEGRFSARRGATLVEFAFVAPLLFTLIFSIIEFSRILMVQNAVTDGARDAAREASLATSRNASTVESNLRTRISQSVPTGTEMTVSVVPADLSQAKSGDEVSVRVSLTYSDVSWVPASLFNISGNSQLRAESRMERE
ncbi:MAG: pilus assembly protein [Planctomycetaceae bacterium]|jgi:Flp pilus assembly protein TadG|nr:pilus assembly protein [Planctomycetaceae bacterium]MDG2390100.1 pilus assembly protein [Planctomycetaceae bacterium]